MDISPELLEYIIEQIRRGNYQIEQNSVRIQILPDRSDKKYIYRLPSGRWNVKARHPETGRTHNIGTWETLEEAQKSRDEWLKSCKRGAPVIDLNSLKPQKTGEK